MKTILILIACALISPGIYDVCKAVQTRRTADAQVAAAATAEFATLKAQQAATARSERIAALIAQKQLSWEMTKAEVLASWGTPIRVNITAQPGMAEQQQWVYSLHTYVYFTGEKITGMQTGVSSQASPHPPRETTWSYVPGLDRYVEHDRGVSAMRSIGLNANR